MQFIQIKIPLGESNSTMGFRIDVNLGANKGNVLNRVRVALDEMHARTKNERHVQTNSDVLRWICEQMDDAIKAGDVIESSESGG